MSDIRKIIAEGFFNGVNETIIKMTGFNLMENTYQVDAFKDEVSGIMFMNGVENVVLLISTQKKAASVYVSYMTGVEAEFLSDDDINDGIMEILNMSAGIAKSVVDNYKFELTSPISISGDSILLKTKKYVEKYEYKLCSDDMDIKIGIYYV